MRAFNAKMIDMAHANVGAVLDLSHQIVTAKAPSDIVELWTTHAHKQFEMLSEQSKELAALAHKMAGESAETITRSVNQMLIKMGERPEMRHDQQSPPEGMAEQQASNELVKMIDKLRLMGLKDEATSLDKSVRRREVREIIGREIKVYIDLAEPIPERLTDLIN